MSIIGQIKTIFTLSCPKCCCSFDFVMREKWDAGYNTTCSNCGVYIENDRF